MKNTLSRILLAILVLLAIGAYFGYDLYNSIYGINVPEKLEDPYLNIPTNSSFEEVVNSLDKGGFLIDKDAFLTTADKMSYGSKIRAGRWEIQPGISNRKLIQHLRSGRQSPVKVVFHNKRLNSEVAGVVSEMIEADSASILNLLEDKNYLSKFGFTPETAMAIFIPNTYEFFWNTDANAFIERMIRENKKFWNEDRLAKAKKQNLSPTEVYTLASIVESESKHNPEKARIAGLYLNRLNTKGWLMESDPTVVFAWKEFGLKRVLKRHLEIDNPYNTYKYAGLPPGPIYMAPIGTIDAVLNPEKHGYFFMCADPDKPGTHAFAKTLSGHLRNARKYQNANFRRR